jgi:hypothetical protein
MPEDEGLFAPYEARSIRFCEMWNVMGWSLKAYAITLAGEEIAPKLWLAARDAVSACLKGGPTKLEHYGVGFVTVHQGKGENQVNLDIWVNQNELLHSVWVSPKDASSRLAPPPGDHNSVCVWEIYVQSFERHAWIGNVLNNPFGPDMQAYLTSRLDTDV